MSDTSSAEERRPVTLADMTPYMQQLPMVLWDRYIQFENRISVYGWIERASSSRELDFVLLDCNQDGLLYWTSSATHSAEIARLLDGGDDDHVSCQLIEDAGVDVKVVRRGHPTNHRSLETRLIETTAQLLAAREGYWAVGWHGLLESQQRHFLEQARELVKGETA